MRKTTKKEVEPDIPARRYYPWLTWLGPGPGHSFTLRRGEDYDCAPHGMVALLRNTAGSDRWRLKLEVNVDRADGHTIRVSIVGRLPRIERRKKA